MNIEKYSERVRGFLQSAQTKALADGNPQFAPEHVLKVLLDDEQGMAASLIERMEKEGLIGPANHAGKREILVPTEDEITGR